MRTCVWSPDFYWVDLSYFSQLFSFILTFLSFLCMQYDFLPSSFFTAIIELLYIFWLDYQHIGKGTSFNFFNISFNRNYKWASLFNFHISICYLLFRIQDNTLSSQNVIFFKVWLQVKYPKLGTFNTFKGNYCFVAIGYSRLLKTPLYTL